ncbi:Hypothetical protein SMAX5B_008448, partial [Scophthalmus maximus]
SFQSLEHWVDRRFPARRVTGLLQLHSIWLQAAVNLVRLARLEVVRWSLMPSCTYNETQ